MEYDLFTIEYFLFFSVTIIVCKLKTFKWLSNTDKKIRVCCYSSVVIFSYTGNKGVGGVTLRCDSPRPITCLDRMRQFS